MRTIVTYITTDDVPDELRAVAFFRDPKGFLPLRIIGKTEAEARSNAEAWWEAELEKRSKSTGGKRSVAKGVTEPVATHPPQKSEDDFEDLLA